MDFPKLFGFEEQDHFEEIEMRPVEETYQNLLTELSTKFGRIAKAIEMTWGSQECDAYLSRLIIDDRGNRQGFPKEIFTVLIKLSSIHAKVVGEIQSKDRWLDNYLK